MSDALVSITAIPAIGFTAEQQAALDTPAPFECVAVREGPGGQPLCYLEPHYMVETANRIFGHGNWSRRIVQHPTAVLDIETNKTAKARLPSEGQLKFAASIAGATGIMPTVDEVSDVKKLSAWIDANKPAQMPRDAKPAQLPQPMRDAQRSVRSRFFSYQAIVEISVTTPGGQVVVREGNGVSDAKLNLDDGSLAGAIDTAVKGCVSDAMKRALTTFGKAFGANLADARCPIRQRAERAFTERLSAHKAANGRGPVAKYPTAEQIEKAQPRQAAQRPAPQRAQQPAPAQSANAAPLSPVAAFLASHDRLQGLVVPGPREALADPSNQTAAVSWCQGLNNKVANLDAAATYALIACHSADIEALGAVHSGFAGRLLERATARVTA